MYWRLESCFAGCPSPSAPSSPCQVWCRCRMAPSQGPPSPGLGQGGQDLVETRLDQQGIVGLLMLQLHNVQPYKVLNSCRHSFTSTCWFTLPQFRFFVLGCSVLRCTTVDFSCVEKSVGSVWFVCAIGNKPNVWHAQTIRFQRNV